MKVLEEIKYAAGKATLSLKRNAPTILMGAGVIGVVGSAVLACIATRKLDSILEEKNKKIDNIHRKQEDEELRQSGKFTEKDAKKELTLVYMETGKDLAKLYAPSVIWGIGSLTALIGSHILLNERIVTLATSYTAILSSFNHYRDNVKERFGEKVDFQLKHNIKTSEIEVTNVDEKGNTTTTKETIEYVDPKDYKYSGYARIFDESNPNWTRDPDYNKLFLTQVQNHANDLLKSRGYLFLNEVYEMLGFSSKTQIGQQAGWTYNKHNPNMQDGDGFVDFGIYDINSLPKRDFINGYEKSIILDFNVEENILYKLPKWLGLDYIGSGNMEQDIFDYPQLYNTFKNIL